MVIKELKCLNIDNDRLNNKSDQAALWNILVKYITFAMLLFLVLIVFDQNIKFYI